MQAPVGWKREGMIPSSTKNGTLTCQFQDSNLYFIPTGNQSPEYCGEMRVSCLRPHALNERHLVDKLVLQRAQDMQTYENKQRRRQEFMALMREARQHCIFANGHINGEQAKEIHWCGFAICTNYEPTCERHDDHEDVE